MTFQWSDYSGEGMCTRCGTPYQLKWGSEKQMSEAEYPYLSLAEDWVPIVRAYYSETGCFVYLGQALGHKPGMKEFIGWLKEHHPERLTTETNDAE